MKRTDIKQMAFVAITTLLVASCASEDMTEGNQLPEGKYPVVIDAVNVSGNAQTRVSENADGSSSVFDWDGTEQIGVSINGKSAIYKLNTDNTISSEDPLYWSNTDVANVSAQYPATDGTVDLSNQASGLAYVMTGTGTGNYANKVTLSFTHLLAKIRVVPDGNVKGEVTAVQIKTHQSCTLKDGALSTDGAAIDFIAMHPATYDGVKCWEANVVPGYEIKDVMVTLNSGGTSQFILSTPVTPVAGKCHNVSVTVDRVVDLNSVEGNTYTVNDNVSIILDGKGTSLNKKLVIGTGATVVLRNVILNCDAGDAIEVNGTATLILSGTNQLESSSRCPLAVARNSTLTINGTNDDKLTLIGKAQDNYGTLGLKTGANLIINGGYIIADGSKTSESGIGSYWGGSSGDACGTITINGGIIEVTGGKRSAGIGSGVDNECGNIIITGGNITAKGGHDYRDDGAGIGSGKGGACGNITISGTNTVVTATAGGSNCDDIGKGFEGTCGTVTITEASVTATHGKIHGQ